MSFKRRLQALEARTAGYRSSECVEQATDQQLITILVQHDTILYARACALGRPLRPSDVTDDDLRRILLMPEESLSTGI